MDFEWDEAKRLANILKHGIDFADAIAMFTDAFIETEDRRRHLVPIGIITRANLEVEF